MAITLSDGTTTVELHPSLQWVDQYSWSAVEQSAEYSLTGALVVQQGLKQTGRPITLASNGGAWVTKATVEAVFSLYNQSGPLTLDIHGTAYPFQFERPEGFKATEVMRRAGDLQAPDHYYEITIKGFEVAA